MSKNYFWNYVSQATFLQILKNVALLEEKLIRGDKNIPQARRSPKKGHAE